MQVPICEFDAKNAVLCPQCESRIESGDLTRADADASIKLSDLAKHNPKIDRFRLHKCTKVDDNHVIYLSRNDIHAIRQSKDLYGLIRDKFASRIWLINAQEDTDSKFIEDLFFPTKVLSVSSVWQPGGEKKTRTIISGKKTHKFPIDVKEAARIIKITRKLDIEIEFEDDKS